MKRLAIIFIFSLSLLGVDAAWAADAVTVEKTPTLQISIGSFTSQSFEPVHCIPGEKCEIPWLAVYINAIYRYGVTIAAILAVVVIMVGGFLWLTSAGNPSRVGSAKEYITSALVGLLIVLFSFILLQTVNPELVELEGLKVDTVDPSQRTCCQKDGVPAWHYLGSKQTCANVGDGYTAAETSKCVDLDRGLICCECTASYYGPGGSAPSFPGPYSGISVADCEAKNYSRSYGSQTCSPSKRYTADCKTRK